MRPLGLVVGVMLYVSGVPATATTPLPATVKPGASVILYVMDTLRADRMSLYGAALATSQRLDRLATRGRVFERAYAQGPSTSLTVPALLASRYPIEMQHRLGPHPGERVLAEVFQAAGYATAGFQANFGLLADLGYDRGFSVYRTLKRREGTSWAYWNAREVNAAALDWVASLPPEQSFFLWVQVMDVHFPYAPPARYRGRFHSTTSPERKTKEARLEGLIAKTDMTDEQRATFRARMTSLDPDRYDECIAWVTDEFVRFIGTLRRLGRLDDTFVVLTSDHGEPLGLHGTMLHGTNLHEEQLHVPLVVWGPGVLPGRHGSIVSLVDVAPTLVDLGGLPIPTSFLGRSLARPTTNATSDVAVGEMPAGVKVGSSAAEYCREGRWKLIRTPTDTRLFDLEQDPGELEDVSADHPDIVTRLEAIIDDRISRPERTQRDGPAATLPNAVRDELRQSLKALGYAE